MIDELHRCLICGADEGECGCSVCPRKYTDAKDLDSVILTIMGELEDSEVEKDTEGIKLYSQILGWLRELRDRRSGHYKPSKA